MPDPRIPQTWEVCVQPSCRKPKSACDCLGPGGPFKTAVLLEEALDALREEHRQGPYDPQHFTPQNAAAFLEARLRG